MLLGIFGEVLKIDELRVIIPQMPGSPEIKRPSEIEGVIFLLYKDGRFLIEKRVKEGSGFYGHYIIPRGEIEKGESPLGAAGREVGEEIGVSVKSAIFLDTFNDVTLNCGFHRFHAFLVKDFEGEVCGLEPDKSILEWVTPIEARQKLELASSRLVLFLAERKLIEEGYLKD